MWNSIKKGFEFVTRVMVGGNEPDADSSDFTPETGTATADVDTDILDNAIDNRDRAVKLIVDTMKSAIGTTASALAHLVIWVQVDSPDYDPLAYAWADDKMLDNLRLALDNAMLEAVGAGSITLRFAVKEDIKASRTVVKNALYCSWQIPEPETHTEGHNNARISLISGSGSLEQEYYILDGEKKSVYHIGRGHTGQHSGSYRINDIVIENAPADETAMQANSFVSSAHADIIYRNSRFYLKACPGGCRSTGGSPTKLIHNEKALELSDVHSMHPINHGDMIELGKSVLLLFSSDKQ